MNSVFRIAISLTLGFLLLFFLHFLKELKIKYNFTSEEIALGVFFVLQFFILPYIFFSYIKYSKLKIIGSGQIWLFRLLGIDTMCAGLIILIGNMTGALTTFPFAGFITITCGAFIYSASQYWINKNIR